MTTDTYAPCTDPVAEFFARGGTIKKCPPAYVVDTPNATSRCELGDYIGWDEMEPEERRRRMKERAAERARLAERQKAEKETQRAEGNAVLQRVNAEKQARAKARRHKLREQYEAGATVRDLARQEGVAEKTMRDLLREAGAALRQTAQHQPAEKRYRPSRMPKTTWKAKGGPRPFTATELEWAAKARDGWSINRIAKEYGKPSSTVGGALCRMRKAGIEVGAGRLVLTEQQIEQIRELHAKRLSARAIALAMGLHRDTVRGRLSRMGLSAPVTQLTRVISQGVDLERDRRILALLAEGHSQIKVAQMVGCSKGGVSAAVRRQRRLAEGKAVAA